MKQGEKEKPSLENNNKKNKIKRKRQTSIITIFLWIFLIVTMLTITLSGIRNKSALEVTDNNWNIQLVMYDKTSTDTSSTAITEFTWNATNENEAKVLCQQINYACTTGKEYKSGEIVITIPGIAKDSFSEYYRERVDLFGYESWLEKNVIITADKENDATKQYDWSYSYNETTNMYTFTNNITIAENEHFEGTIQIVYNLEPIFRIQTDLQFQAKIKENIEGASQIIAMESNVCDFHYTSTKKNYTLTKNASIPKASEVGSKENASEYYWVKYVFNTSSDNNNIIKAEYAHKIKDEFPEGCIVYREDILLSADDENVYNLFSFGNKNPYYVGYPKNQYSEGDLIINKAEYWGRYEDEVDSQKLAEAEVSISLVNIEFKYEYEGEPYSIEKTAHTYNSAVGSGSTSVYLNQLKGVGADYYINPRIFYTDALMDVEIGDDLLYVTRSNGEVTQLKEDEYSIQSIGRIGYFYTYDEKTNDKGDRILDRYDYEIQVRYRGTDEYVTYKTYTNKALFLNVGIKLPSKTVGVKLVIKDLNKTIYSGNIGVNVKVYSDDVALSGKLYNFSYMNVYKKDEEGNRTLANEVTLDSYTTPTTLKIAEYDIATYGKYMMRSYAETNIIEGKFYLQVNKYFGNINNNVPERKYETDLRYYIFFENRFFNANEDNIAKIYDILPQGVTLISTEEEIKDSLGIIGYYSRIVLKDGTSLTNNDMASEYLKNKIDVDIDYDYKGSGRTKIEITFDLNDINWMYYAYKSIYSLGVQLNLKTGVSYDSITEYGENYTNYIYGIWNYDYDIIEPMYGGGISNDNGVYDALAIDLDNDGDTEEKLAYDLGKLSITYAVSSQQAVIKQVRTNLTKGAFVEGTAEATAGSKYTYKLRVTTGANKLKDLILYDTLETIYDENGNEISSGWKGEFVGVDTTYAESKGYAPVVYYSEEKNPGKLTEDETKWKVLDDNVDKSKVKSICVDLRHKADGSEYELAANSAVFVLIDMKAPEDETITTSANNMFKTNWRAIGTAGESIDNVEGIYSNQVSVEISKKEIKEEIKGKKIWIDENNKYNARPESIVIKLMQDGQEYASVTTDASKNWEYTFENVPVYKSNTSKYEYSVVEENVPNYKTSYLGYDITNEIELTELTVRKIWDDNENEAEKRPSSVVLQVKTGERVVEEYEVSQTDGWEHTFELPKYDSLGNEIVYTVDEEYVNEFYIKEIVGNIITNKFTVPEDKIKITGTKVWDDLEDYAKKRPESVILQVIGDGEVITEHEVNSGNNWSYEFEVAKYDRYGNEIEYHIDERDIGSKFYVKELTDDYTVTNKFKVPDEKVNVEVMKIWDDNNNEAVKRPGSIKLQVKNNGVVVAEQVVTEAEGWKHTFELPKYNETGDEIKYTVDEEFTSEFYVKNIVGNVITNKFVVPEDRIKLVGKKVWEDNGNAGGKRDSSIILQVKAGEEVVAEAEVNDKNNWEYEFELAKYDRYGNEIKYHIDERETENKFYEKELTDDTTVTNKFKVPEEVVLVKAVKKWEDQNDKYSKRPASVTLQVKMGEKVVAEEKVNEKNHWSYEIKLPKYDSLGDEIKYTADEKDTPRYYEKKIEGETVINTCTYEPPVDTGDINIFVYVIISLVAIVGVVVGIFMIKRGKKSIK